MHGGEFLQHGVRGQAAGAAFNSGFISILIFRILAEIRHFKFQNLDLGANKRRWTYSSFILLLAFNMHEKKFEFFG